MASAKCMEAKAKQDSPFIHARCTSLPRECDCWCHVDPKVQALRLNLLLEEGECAMSAADPKSKEDLRKLADKRRVGGHLSRNEQWELDQAQKKGVKGVFD